MVNNNPIQKPTSKEPFNLVTPSRPKNQDLSEAQINILMCYQLAWRILHDTHSQTSYGQFYKSVSSVADTIGREVFEDPGKYFVHEYQWMSHPKLQA